MVSININDIINHKHTETILLSVVYFTNIQRLSTMISSNIGVTRRDGSGFGLYFL